MAKTTKNLEEVLKYAHGVADGSITANIYRQKSCQRFIDDYDSDRYDFKTEDAEFVIGIIEKTFCHAKGEMLDGTPLRGTPFLLESFHKFIIYNILGFFIKGTQVRRFHEAFIYIPRKNIKTTFAGALAFALGLLNRRSGSQVYITSAALKQSLESFNFIKYNVERMGLKPNELRIADNNNEHSIRVRIGDDEIAIMALAANPDSQDSFNCNLAIADEMHAYKNPKQYNIIKEAMKAYSNKLMIGITTAGDNINSFCYHRLQYCKKVLDGQVEDEQYFIFICEADADANGNIDYTNPKVHEAANPAYGVSIRPADIMNDALQAQNDPQQRKDFFAKSLNVYTSALKAYFNLDEFRRSDEQYTWTIPELAKLPIKWYGGTDLSKLHDLTAAVIVAEYKDVLIIIPHCWFPIVRASQKAEEDGIPLFGWKDDGWLDMCNDEVLNHDDVVKWYIDKRNSKFKIKQVGHDRKFCRKYFIAMKKAKFDIVDQPQYFYKKSEGFRYIEAKAKSGKLYYLHAEPFEYCVSNVKAIEKTDDMVEYSKIHEESRIDVFDAAVFATVRMLEDTEKAAGKKIGEWFGGEES